MQGVSFTLSMQEIIGEKRPWTCIYLLFGQGLNTVRKRRNWGVVTAVNQVISFTHVRLLKELVYKVVDWI